MQFRPVIEEQLHSEQGIRAAVQDDLDHFTHELTEFQGSLGTARDDMIQCMATSRREALDEVASLRENLQRILDYAPQWGEALLNPRSLYDISSMQWTLMKEECHRSSVHRQLADALQSIETLGANLDSAATQSQMNTLRGILDEEIRMQKVLLRHLLPGASNYSTDRNSEEVPIQARGAIMLSLVSELTSAMKVNTIFNERTLGVLWRCACPMSILASTPAQDSLIGNQCEQRPLDVNMTEFVCFGNKFALQENGAMLAIWGALMESLQQEKAHRTPAQRCAELLCTAEMHVEILNSADQPPLTYTNRQTDLSLQELGTGLRNSQKVVLTPNYVYPRISRQAPHAVRCPILLVIRQPSWLGV